MKSQTKPTPAQREIIKRDPQLFTNREELWLALRETVISGDTQRANALQERDDILRDKWRAEHAEEIAELEREEREEEARRNREEELFREMADGDPEKLELLTRFQHERFRAINRAGEAEQFEQRAKSAEAEKMQIAVDAETQRRRADRAEAGQTPRGVPFDKTTLIEKLDGHEFTPADFCEALKREKGHEAAIRRALTSYGKVTKRGSRWALTRDQAKDFWKWHNRAKHKAHPPRAKNKIARK